MYIVTGGAGFIGSVLLWQMNMQGIQDILVVDNLASSEKWRNLLKREYLDYMHRDRFHDLLLRGRLPQSIDGVIHLGACSSTTEQNADFLMENNFHYSRDVCRYCLERDIRLIVASSAATYGDGSAGFSDDPDLIPSLRPLNMYGYSKHLLDLWLLREHVPDGLVSLKFFNVYGPNEYHKGEMQSVVRKAYHQILREGRVSLFASTRSDLADGEQKRDFVYVKDCTALIMWLLQNRDVSGIHNVGTGTAASYNRLARAVFSAMNRPERIEYIPMPGILEKKYQNYTCADMHWLETECCPVSFCSIERGAADYVQNHLMQEDPYL